jgi:hypothetical protein
MPFLENSGKNAPSHIARIISTFLSMVISSAFLSLGGAH